MASRLAKAVVIILCLTGWIAEVAAGQGRTGTDGRHRHASRCRIKIGG